MLLFTFDDFCRRKKCKLATTAETPLEREDAAVVNKSNDVKKKKRKTLDVQRDENDEENDANATMTKSKK